MLGCWLAPLASIGVPPCRAPTITANVAGTRRAPVAFPENTRFPGADNIRDLGRFDTKLPARAEVTVPAVSGG
jgi:hypothetical protein